MPDYSSAALNALSGGASGASLGSLFGPIGTAIGGVGGALAGGLPSLLSSPQPMQRRNSGQYGGNQGPQGNFLTGYGSYTEQLPRFTPQQSQALNMLLQRGLAGSDFGAQENLARQQFASQTIPSIAERFTAMGGGQRSSAFQGALGQAGAGLESQLAALRSQYGLQQLGLGLSPMFENIYTPAQPGLGMALAQGVGAALPGFASSYFQGQSNNQMNSNLLKAIQELIAKVGKGQ